MSDIECVLSCDPADARRSQVSGPASVKLVTEGRAGVGDQAPVADVATGSTDSMSCDPADNRRSQVSGPVSVKLATDGRAGVGDQAPAADSATGSTNLGTVLSQGGCRPCSVVLSDGESRGTASRFWRKRPRDEVSDRDGSIGLSSSEEDLSAPKVPTARRGRKPAPTGGGASLRPPRDSRGRFLRSATPAASEESDVGVRSEDPGGVSCVSLGSTKAELNAAKREQRRAVAVDEVTEMARRARERRAALAASGEMSAVALSQQVLGGVDVVLKVATQSGNLKGTFTRALKEAAADIKEAVGDLLNRTASDEVTKLQEENSRLRRDLEDLRRQVAALSEQQQPQSAAVATPPMATPTPAPGPTSAHTDDEVERIVRLCMLQCGSMMNARIEAISRRLPQEPILRPTLAADKRRTEEPPRPAPQKGKPAEGVEKPVEGTPSSVQPTTAGSKGETWAKVVGRKKARKAAKKAAAPAAARAAVAQPARRTAKKTGGRNAPAIRAPRSEAVTLTLQPGAAERGVTYQSVIAEAKAKIKLADLGLQSVTLRQAATGARLFEVAGAASDSVEKADALAAKMKEVLNPEDVRVSRPMKTAEVRIAGLDDSVTSEEVAAAVARGGECPPDKVRAGDIRVDATGLGVVWVRCPVASAKKIADSGRLLVGWVAARVKLLQPRALRCFRCLEKGHVRAKCTAEIDRSDLCYRCGQPGHKAAQCSAAPNCCLCSAVGKPAGHKLRGRLPAQDRCRGNGVSIIGHLHFLQGNINHCARAQDLLLQSMAEWSIDVAVVAEPYFIPARDNWLGCADGLVAIIGGTLTDPSRGRGWVAAVSGGIVIVGAYFSPNKSLADFEGFLVELGAVVGRHHPRPVLVLGDLNAKSSAWGSPVTDPRGEVLEEWAVTTGLVVLNRGSEYTCVRQRGGSIVDVSFASPSVASRVRDWRVAVEVETLSDHRYIRFDVSAQTASGRHPTAPINDGPRWALKCIDKELLEEAALVQSWIWESATDGPVDVEAVALRFRGAMTQICDASMPRVRQQSARRQVYWWTAEIAQLRIACVAARRQYTRYRRRRRRVSAEEDALYEVYSASKETLWLAIGDSKSRAREELLGSLDRDPWGRPYRWVRGKLRAWAPPLVQSMQPQLLGAVVLALFPERAGHVPPTMASPSATDSPEEESTDVPEVTQAETRAAVSRLRAKNTAPGPDGVPGRALVLALKELEPQLRGLFTACLEQGQFPSVWKEGRLVLLRKEGRPADSPSAYRPIVLLDEAGKLFERVIADRLVSHLCREGPDLDDNQFGFRRGRSTVDAIMRVRALAEETVSQGGVVLAVSLDISNAFNTLPWSCIREALRYHRVPPYLRRTVGAYLEGRCVTYRGHDGAGRHLMTCGVPQGSVLGPLLWNIGYDWVLRGELPSGADLTCYADDTLVTARGSSHREAALIATAAVSQVVNRIRRLGLEVALNKSEAMVFHGPRRAPPSGSHIVVGGARIAVESTMKYLGLVLDSRWEFGPHFRRLVPKLMGAAGALSTLLPNMGGPSAACRRLYVGIVRSMALYGAPVWAMDLAASTLAILRRPQRAMAVRVVRGYRTISYEAACVLAGSPPWDLEAKVLASLYRWREEERARDSRPVQRQIAQRRAELRQVLVAEWRQRLLRPTAGLATVEAIRPVLDDWLGRRHGSLSFRVTQVLSGHGCFGKYLCRIGREPDARCHHCVHGGEDTAQHTFVQCVAWEEQRRVLTNEVGGDLSLPAVVRKMVGSAESWDAVVSFCEDVMSQKEAAEREREISTADPARSRRSGRRRRADNALFRPP
nr:uncharacterized protein LOC126053518 [Helicoverpa armigera]XP_049704749.1 uncharacterized protein LOC126056273 [Helicoverpa armigera]XP_049706070.1 uncharacterized protein LOC126056578 [Helicoverpa armigera]